MNYVVAGSSPVAERKMVRRMVTKSKVAIASGLDREEKYTCRGELNELN